jgi:hypothetical protein
MWTIRLFALIAISFVAGCSSAEQPTPAGNSPSRGNRIPTRTTQSAPSNR